VEILTESPSWHVRVKALPVIQVFYFKHLFTLTKAEMIKVMDVVSGMLMDMQIEVRIYEMLLQQLELIVTGLVFVSIGSSVGCCDTCWSYSMLTKRCNYDFGGMYIHLRT